MELAIAAARKSTAEDERTHPMVGAVAVRGNQILGTAYRGESGPGHHAEYVLLEKKLQGESLEGATIYTTLEPCTSRNHPKTPCVERIISRGVKRVVIGTFDPNPDIRGLGVLRLRDAGVAIDVFDVDRMVEVEELNRDFIAVQRKAHGLAPPLTAELLDQLHVGSLQAWYQTVNSIYWNRNFHLRPAEILVHLVEVVGGLSSIASNKRKPGVDANAYVAKALAWWLALSGKLGISNIEDMLWDKFPSCCPYCHARPCLGDQCAEMKRRKPGPDWQELSELGTRADRPERLGEWQRMFGAIYPAGQVSDLGAVFGRLSEELGEVAEAVRIFPAEPGYYLSEASDVFAWLMQVQNHLDRDAGIDTGDRGFPLERVMARSYPGGCRDCGRLVCACPPILPSTIGRIAHEVPAGSTEDGEDGRFVPPDKARRLFQSPERRTQGDSGTQ